MRPVNNVVFGAHPTISRFMKSIFELRPVKPRYNAVWDVNVVLNYLETLFPLKDISLKKLTIKLTMVIALVSAQRPQSTHLLNINNMVRKETSFLCTIDRHVKQSRPGYKLPVIELSKFPDNC